MGATGGPGSGCVTHHHACDCREAQFAQAVRLLREAKQYCPFYFVATGSGTSVIPGDLYMKIDTFLSTLATPTPTQEDADEE